MTVTISPDDPRSVRALAVLATADRWVKGHTKDGRPFFVVPGSHGRVYWTDTRDCTCPDRRARVLFPLLVTWVVSRARVLPTPVVTMRAPGRLVLRGG